MKCVAMFGLDSNNTNIPISSISTLPRLVAEWLCLVFAMTLGQGTAKQAEKSGLQWVHISLKLHLSLHSLHF